MIAIQGGTVNTITRGVIENGTVLVEDDKIKAVGRDLPIPRGAQVIDAGGMVVMPGLIDCHTHIAGAMAEPNTMPGAADDGNEMTDPITPYVRMMDALNPCDTAIAKARAAGFTTLYTGPGSANIIGGTGISIKLRGRTAEEMALPGSAQMKFALGENPKRCYGPNGKMPKTRMAVAALLRETLFNARNYSDALLRAEAGRGEAPKPDFRLDALVDVVRGAQKVRIHCHRSDDIMTAIRIGEEYQLDFSLEHVTEGYKIADILAKKQIPCVVGPLLTGPYKQELWDARLENAGILAKAGVKLCIMADGAGDTAWLPMQIGLLLRRGLEEEAAFRAVTINPAQLLCLEDRVGSLEEGKDADIALFDGHPFSSMSLCRLTMIDGVIEHNAL